MSDYKVKYLAIEMRDMDTLGDAMSEAFNISLTEHMPVQFVYGGATITVGVEKP